jgi:hypothetical protein
MQRSLRTVHDPAFLAQLDSPVFSPSHFEAAGVFVIRGVVESSTLARWQKLWDEFYTGRLQSQRKVNPYNPVAVDEQPPGELAEIYKYPLLLDVIEQAFGPDIALFNQRFVIKDHQSRGPVFLHSDFPYHLGFPRKASAFLALSPANAENGGMVFYPGTHHYGYLGDAGELDADFLDPDWPTLCPSLEPGDVALMNSCTWHRSGPHVSGPDRVLADIIYQPAGDPSSKELLRGQWQTDLFVDRKKPMFKRSRVKRLEELQGQVDEFKLSQSAQPAS